MATKAQYQQKYKHLPPFLKDLREEAGLTQRDLGKTLNKPQSWIYNCETGNRRVDVIEFIDWVESCGVKPQSALGRLLKIIR